jgi:hypothetical protein
MITPAYSPTATERVLPRMALDFTTGVLDSRVTVTRALNTATRINSSGIVETVNANLPRFDYDSATLLPKGLLIEESRTNLQTYSAGAFNTQYTKAGSPTVSDNSASGIGGPLTASAVTGAAVGDYIYRDATTVITTKYTRSIYVSNVNATQSRLVVRSSSSACDVYLNWSGATLSSLSVSAGAASFVDCGNGVYRVILVYTALETTDRLRITPASVVGSATINIYGSQLEAGAFATSYIPTTTTSVTRNADVVSMTGTNLTSWCDTAQGTILSEHTVAQFNAANTIFAYSLGSAAAAEIYAGIQATGGNQFTVANTTNQANFGGFAAGSLNVPQKVCGFYQANNFAASANGIAGGTDTSGSLPTINKLVFGARNDGARTLNGWVRKFSYWPFPLTTAEVTAFSKQ